MTIPSDESDTTNSDALHIDQVGSPDSKLTTQAGGSCITAAGINSAKSDVYYMKLIEVALPYYNSFPEWEKKKVTEAVYEQVTGGTYNGKIVQGENIVCQELYRDKMIQKIGQSLVELKDKASNLTGKLHDHLKVRTLLASLASNNRAKVQLSSDFIFLSNSNNLRL